MPSPGSITAEASSEPQGNGSWESKHRDTHCLVQDRMRWIVVLH